MQRRIWLLGTLVLLAFSPALDVVGAQTTFVYPVRVSHFHITADTGAPPGFVEHHLLKTTPGAMGQAIFFPVLGVIGEPLDTAVWVGDTVSGATYRFDGDAIATLEFAPVNVDAVGTFTVELRAVSLQGSSTLVASATKTFNLPTLLATTENFTLPASGQTLPKGAALMLTLRADQTDVLTIVNYGGSSASSLHLQTRLQDTNGNGIPDDVDGCPPTSSCPSTSNDYQTYQQYANYYNTTAGTGPPGAVTGPSPPTGVPPTAPPAGNGPNAPGKTSRWELYAGGGMGGVMLLTALGGLFGRHAR